MRFAALLSGVIGLNTLAYITIRLRPYIFKVKLYRPMIQNIKLSALPLIILAANIVIFTLLSMIGGYTEINFISAAAYVVFFIGLAVWMLFLPNSGYLITELNLNHRENDGDKVPMWYDIVSVLGLALSGVVNTLLNIVIVQLSFLVVFDPRPDEINYPGLFLSGVLIVLPVVTGIYFGRTIRLNSWDILHPRAFITKLKDAFSAKGAWKDFIMFIVINTIFFLIMYVAFGVPFYFM